MIRIPRNHLIASITAAIIVFGVCGCGSREPLSPISFDVPLPPVAAQFRTTVRESGKPEQSVDWRLWRAENRIERENLQARTGEIWQRDGKSLFHSELYHEYQRGIEYQAGDLDMLGGAPQWAQQAWVVSPELLGALRDVSARTRDGVLYRRYRGQQAGSDWDITLRMDLMLPQVVERRTAQRTERIELREVHALDRAPWQPTPSRDYGMIDFADLGDHERDPFVRALQVKAGTGHVHAH